MALTAPWYSHAPGEVALQRAPAVRYPVGRSRLQGGLLVLTCLVAVVLTAFLWDQQGAAAGWRQWLFALTLLGTSSLAVQNWLHAPRGMLSWDGQTWHWTSQGAEPLGGILTVHLDFQFCLVVSVKLDVGGRIWLWPQRQNDVVLWIALRRAAFAGGLERQK